MGSMSRKFLSLIVNEHTPGFKTLRCIDLTLQKFFYDAPAAPDGDGSASSAGIARDAATSRLPAASETMRRVWLPSPSFAFRPGKCDDASDEWGMHCFPLGDRKVIYEDQSGLALAFDAETPVVGTISERPISHPREAFLDPWPCPPVTKRQKGNEPRAKRRKPFSLPNLSLLRFRITPKEECCCDQAIFVMERFLLAEPEEENSGQFEAFFKIRPSGHWIRRLIRPPPFAVLKAGKGGSSSSTRSGPVEITAYTVVGRGQGRRVCVPGTQTFSERGICVSAAGAGTYCMNMGRRFPAAWTWTKVGEWTLPFHGKVEYVPELKLWFGFSAESRRLAAADLSGMASRKPPQLVDTWEEIDPPKEWRECRDPQLVNLGSGRFCIARFFHGSSSDGETEEDFAVLTSVEMVPCLDDDSGNGKKVTKLRMIKHESRRLEGGGSIDTVF